MHRDAIGFVERGTVSLEQRTSDCVEAFAGTPTDLGGPCNFLQIGNSDTPFDSFGAVFSWSYEPTYLRDWFFSGEYQCP